MSQRKMILDAPEPTAPRPRRPPAHVGRRQYTAVLNEEMGRLRLKIRGSNGLSEQSGIPVTRLEQIVGGAEPTVKEHRGICRAMPRMHHFERMLLEFRKGEGASTGQEEKPAPTRRLVPVREPEPEPESEPAPESSPQPKVVVADKRLDKPKLAIDESRLSPPPAPPAPPSPLEMKISTTAQFSRIETIDVEVAKLLLQGNVRNRPISMPHVKALARDMLAGKWRLTHQGIALDKDYRLVDGQHRLTAIVESGTTQKMTVTYNVDPESFHSIDVGLQPRSVAQIAGLLRGTKYPTLATAAAKLIWHVLSENVHQPSRTTWTESEVFGVLDVFEADLVWVAERVNGAQYIKQAPVVGALGYAAPVARESIEQFIVAMRSREGMTKTQAAFLKALERMGVARNHDQRIDMFSTTLRALEAHITGEDLGKIFVRTDNQLQQPVFGFFRARRKKLGLPV